MIQHKQEFECHTSASKQTSQFGMVFSQKAVDILGNSLYTHKKRAVIREYSTNAYDSHIDAGVENKPFRIHIPTKLEPFFEVQDYGIGMDNDAVMNTFTTFFMSTKENDNNKVGCLGLGSKSAYGVSDQFSLVCIKDGVLRKYSCYKNKTGMPEVSLKSESPTNLGNGVTIKIPVAVEDVNLWKQEAIDIIARFDVLPEHNLGDFDTILLTEKFNFNQEVKHKGSVVNLKGSGIHQVIMGNVAYPIENITSYIKGKGLRELYNNISHEIDIHLYLPLGELSIAPSREGLSLDYYTKRNLTKVITKVVISKFKELTSTLGDINNVSYYTLFHTFRDTPLWSLVKEMGFSFTNGMVLKRYEWAHNPDKLYIMSGFQGLKGLIPPVGYDTPSVLSSAIHNMNHLRIREWTNIYIAEGISVRLKSTLTSMRDSLGDKCGAILYSDSAQTTKRLIQFFGIGQDKVLKCEDYYVEVERKKATPRNKKVHTKTVMAKVRSIKDNNPTYTEVDLSVLPKVAYFDGREGNCINTYFEGKYEVSVYTNTFSKIMIDLGYDNVIVTNKNNHNKVVSSGIPDIQVAWTGFIKSNLTELVKADVWSGLSDRFNSKERMLLPKCKSWSKLERNISNVTPITNLPLNYLGVKGTKLHLKEEEKAKVLKGKVKEELSCIWRKLPLIDVIHCKDNLKYYLQLEKIIK